MGQESRDCVSNRLFGGLAGVKLAVAALAAAGLSVLVPTAAGAQQLTYTPINPAFGGNPLNSTQLEQDAATQNQYKPKSTTSNLTQSQLFAQELQSQLLASLANQVSEAIFGPNAATSGTFSFGGETVTFTRSLTEVTVTITDPTGSTTVIQLPVTPDTSGTGG
jgi:curli production assembly/transport component CsgF